MAIVMTDQDFESAVSSLPDVTGTPEALTIVEFCSTMTRRLGVLAGMAAPDLPDPAPVVLPPFLVG